MGVLLITAAIVASVAVGVAAERRRPAAAGARGAAVADADALRAACRR